MFYLSEKEYNEKLKKIETDNESKGRRIALKRAKLKTEKALPTTTKLITFYLFVVLNIVLVYSLVAMWHFENLTYLGTLIADVIGQILVFFIYAIKSTKENTSGGIKYETTMVKLQNDLDISIKDKINSVG